MLPLCSPKINCALKMLKGRIVSVQELMHALLTEMGYKMYNTY